MKGKINYRFYLSRFYLDFRLLKPFFISRIKWSIFERVEEKHRSAALSLTSYWEMKNKKKQSWQYLDFPLAECIQTIENHVRLYNAPLYLPAPAKWNFAAFTSWNRNLWACGRKSRSIGTSLFCSPCRTFCLIWICSQLRKIHVLRGEVCQFFRLGAKNW